MDKVLFYSCMKKDRGLLETESYVFIIFVIAMAGKLSKVICSSLLYFHYNEARQWQVLTWQYSSMLTWQAYRIVCCRFFVEWKHCFLSVSPCPTLRSEVWGISPPSVGTLLSRWQMDEWWTSVMLLYCNWKDNRVKIGMKLRDFL